MKQSLLAGVALAIVAVAGAAQAADLPSRRAPSSDYYAPPPLFTWTGLYAGLNIGYGWASFSQGSDQFFGRPSGFEGGVTAGFNWQAPQNFVLGVEGDWDLTSINDTNQLPFFRFTGQGKLTSIATIRPRVGYAFDRALVYATGGLAFGSVSANINDWRSVPFFSSTSSFQAGYAVGAGVEYAFTDHISGKAEFLYTSLGSKDAFAWTPDWIRVGVDAAQLRTGLNYHF
ncbi:MAG: porin family protein [Hyphomicrobiales bacterium]|nr:porin family protein [Hyphomicrobiales bacterium]